MLKWIEDHITLEIGLRLAGVVAALFVFTLIYKILRRHLKKTVFKKLKPQTVMIIEKTVKYVFIVCVALYVLNLFGINLSALLGAAGIAGIAVGFAAQTSVSNIISGFFVLSEHAFQIGDYITVNDISGTVYTIDLLSIKLKTPDNQFVRIPNESVIQTNLINVSYNAERRFSLPVRIPYNSDLEKVEAALLKIAAETELVIEEPAPKVFFNDFGDSSVNATLTAWCKKDDFLDMKNNLIKNVHKGLKETGIEIPFPQVNVHFDQNKNA